MKGTNQKGITLIALIVTIIVLVIIAGISIAALTSDNGILRQTNAAKVDQIEGTAREQVKLGVSALRLAIAEASSKDNSYRADNNAGKIQAKLVEILNQDKSGLNGEFGYGGNDLDDTVTGTELKLNYTGDDYQNACNDTNADIVYTITLGQKIIEITNEINSTLKDQNKNDVNIDVVTKKYLADIAQIGDYVDIGIEYNNVYGASWDAYDSAGTKLDYSPDGPMGWRVLSKTGEGAEGTITLISAGVPMTFYHDNKATQAVQSSGNILSNLNKEITLDGKEGTAGFVKNGFISGNDLANIWLQNKYVNEAITPHAFNETELVTLYNTIMSDTKTMAQIKSENECLGTESMLNKKADLSSKVYDIFTCGVDYYISRLPTSSVWEYYVESSSAYLGSTGGEKGIRCVVTLNSGICISSSNNGNGAYGFAYNLD